MRAARALSVVVALACLCAGPPESPNHPAVAPPGAKLPEPAPPDTPDPPDPEGSRLAWFAIPNVGFDTDDGLGFGARMELAFKEPEFVPYRVAYVLQAYATVLGYHHHRFRYDRTGMGPGGRLRVTMHLAWRQWLNDRYFGIGNSTTRERIFLDRNDRIGQKRNRYSLFQPFWHTTLRARLDGPWRLFGAFATRFSSIETYEGSLLTEEQPFGMDGGLTMEIHGGVLYDTRFPEPDPTEGVLLELSGRYAPPVDDGTGHFGAIFASARGFVSIGDHLVLAGRMASELLIGRVPFYEMVHWGGAIPVAGFGGATTVRGIPFGRWRGPGKLMINTEARIKVIQHLLFGNNFEWLLTPFADAGLAYDVNDVMDAHGPLAPFHPTVGLGIRAVYDDNFVGRVDFGFADDPIVEEDGSVTSALNTGIYIVFDHTF